MSQDDARTEIQAVTADRPARLPWQTLELREASMPDVTMAVPNGGPDALIN